MGSRSQDVQTSLAYNAASQVVTKTRDNDAYAFNGYVNVDRAYTVNGLDQYTSAGPAAFTYDANGNLTSDGSTTYSYDAENRLVLATGAHYVTLAYDPLGRLFQTWSPTNGTTQFLYDGDQLTAEYDGSGNLLRRYVHGPDDDDPLIWYEGPTVASPRYLYSDHQGSIVAVADAAGNRIAANTYDEYGIPGSGNIGRFQYTGQAWIPELGMYYYKARMYSPTLGRFLQTDSIGYGDGLNWYNYVGNDPVNATDPSGTDTSGALQGPHLEGPEVIAFGPIDFAKFQSNFADVSFGSFSIPIDISTLGDIVVNATKPLKTPQNDDSGDDVVVTAIIPIKETKFKGQPKRVFVTDPESRNPFRHADPKGRRDICRLSSIVSGHGAGTALAAGNAAARALGYRAIPVVGEVILFLDAYNTVMDLSGEGCGTYAGE